MKIMLIVKKIEKGDIIDNLQYKFNSVKKVNIEDDFVLVQVEEEDKISFYKFKNVRQLFID